MLFIHVGLHKTGTTFLQGSVFPRWPGLTYVRGLSVEACLKMRPGHTYLASREGLSGGVVASSEEKLTFLRRLSRMLPEAGILISFRDHASYVNALYSQYLRYGGQAPLSKFFDLDRDSGVIKQEDLRFRRYVEEARELWKREPFVFLLSEMKSNLTGLLDDMGGYFGKSPPALQSINTARRNISLGRRQAEALRRLNVACEAPYHPDGSRRPYSRLRRIGMDPPSLCQRWTAWTGGTSIVDKPLAERIGEFYAEDLAYLEERVRQRRQQAGQTFGRAE